MAIFSDLPEGALEEIMSWLPPEPLMRFKLVQKSWYLRINDLMNNTEFVAKHLRNTRKKRMSSSSCRFSFLIVGEQEIPEREEDDADNNDDEEVDGDDDDNDNNDDADDGDDSDDDDDDDDNGYFLVLANADHCDYDGIPWDTDILGDFMRRLCNLESQCDGIICFSVALEQVVCLLNPGIREMKIIRYSLCGNFDYGLQGVGFGYDSRSNEYKVVAITCRRVNLKARGPCRAEVYSLRTNSWREIACDVDMSCGATGGVYCNGVCYWFYKGHVMKMFCFDFRDEVFRDVPLPDWDPPIQDRWLFTMKMCVWNDSIALLKCLSDKCCCKTIEVWVLDSQCGGGGKAGCSYSWTKRVQIGPLKRIKRPLGFWNDVKLIVEAEDGRLKLYDLGSQVLGHLSKPLDWFDDYYFAIYQKSLVSVLGKEGRRSVVQASMTLSEVIQHFARLHC